MFKEFIKFISDDPIMLGLCCAIIFLVVVFILVLIFGGKKKEKEVEENALDNTQSLLKSNITDEPLRSTQEYSISDINDITNTKELPEIEEVEENIAEENAPISVSEAIDIKLERENAVTKDTMEIPVVTNEEPAKVEVQEELSEPVSEISIGVQPFSSVFTSEEQIPVKEETEEVDDDIELPKLNKNEDTSVLNSLEIEEYKL